LESNSEGGSNTATGVNALLDNTSGNSNTAVGVFALGKNTTGSFNTALGLDALSGNTSASGNTAIGVQALYINNGYNNTAVGQAALFNNAGTSNTAIGFESLKANGVGTSNTATGANALGANTQGSSNTAAGQSALGQSNGSSDTAMGVGALESNTTGSNNAAFGVNAMLGNTTGGNNIALGYQAGDNLTSGSNNIDIGNVGVAAESKTIRIGTQGTQTATYVAGIYGSAMVSGGDAVVVGSNGRLGMVMSSARFKRDIQDMGAKSSGLLKLRPVTFRYKSDPSGALQYGLVAEEVARVFPELVSYGPDGKPMTVRYLMLSTMLLNELQKQTAELRKITVQMAREKAATESRIAELEASHQRDLRAMQTGFERRLSALEHSREAASPIAVKF
jgi:hypothetical protein